MKCKKALDTNIACICAHKSLHSTEKLVTKADANRFFGQEGSRFARNSSVLEFS